MVIVTSYQIWIYGSESGYEKRRAYIQLRNGLNVVAGISFIDPEMVFEADSDTSGMIKMHLPSAMFQSVVDILRNEKPMNIFFVGGCGILQNADMEPVGEAEK